MLDTRSIVYSDDLNRALLIEELLEGEKKLDFNLYATDSFRDADPNFTHIKSINKVDQALKMKTEFYKIQTERGYEIVIPNNGKVFLETKKNSNGETLYFDVELLKKALERNDEVLLKLALPRFFTEKSYSNEKLLDRNGAILAIFLSSYSDSSINKPIIKLPMKESSFISKLFLKEEKQLDEIIRNLFGDEIWNDLKVIPNEDKKEDGPDRFITENKHSELYKEILTNILQWIPEEDEYYNANFGFVNGKYLVNDLWRRGLLTSSPRMLYSFIYHLLKIESYNTSDYYIPYNKNCQSIARDLQDLAFIGNLVLVNNPKEGRLYYEKDTKIKQDFPVYDKLASIEKIEAGYKRDYNFVNLNVNFNKLVVNGFITYIDD